MSDDYGYPVTTNRAGSWTPGRPDPAVAARRANPVGHLTEVLRPVKEKGIQSRSTLGLDDEAAKLRDLVNHDPAEVERLGRAINAAVDASRMTHPHIIAADRKDHQISQGETKRRIQWCIQIAQQMRFDMKWSLARICEKLPHLLGSFLDGTFYTDLHERRRFFAKGKIPRGLKKAAEE